MPFQCNTCGDTRFKRVEIRGDGKRVLFCATCTMGMIEDPPSSTDRFYEDGYYGGVTGNADGYHDYELTAAHTQLWVQLLIMALEPEPARQEAAGQDPLPQEQVRILDIGCADGTMLHGLPEHFSKHGIEANAAAAGIAATRGVTIVSSDVADPRLAALDGTFDIVSSIATFEHVLDMRGAFEVALRLLKPHGLLLFEVPLMSDTADNKDWLHGSYEHITYPTVTGLAHLLDGMSGILWRGVESQIKDFSASYIGLVTRCEHRRERADQLMRAMCASGDPSTLTIEERRLNISYKLVHSFEARPEHVLALPDLFEVARSKPLLRRLSQMWHADALTARNAEYYQQQAQNWHAAYDNLHKVTVALQDRLALLDSAAVSDTANARDEATLQQPSAPNDAGERSL